MLGDGGTVLQLGGNDYNKKWHNISLTYPSRNFPDGTIDLHHDLRLGIPSPDNSYQVVYSSHFLEHVPTTQGFEILLESYRVLRDGGIIRLSLPNVYPIIKAYIEKDDKFFMQFEDEFPDGLPLKEIRSPIDHIVRACTFWEHVTMYDVGKTIRLLKAAGFEHIKEVDFDSYFDPIDRKSQSFYVSGVKVAH